MGKGRGKGRTFEGGEEEEAESGARLEGGQGVFYLRGKRKKKKRTSLVLLSARVGDSNNNKECKRKKKKI